MHIDATWFRDASPICGTMPGNPLALASAVAKSAYTALIKEVELTPKPGLVDQFNTGSHRDMDIGTFRASAEAIAPWFSVFFRLGLAECELPARDLLALLRADGLACERDMLRATGGVNTHKGSIFSLGLLCAAAGRMVGTGRRPDHESMCAEVAQMCSGLVSQELMAVREARTAGELLYQKYHITGARGEAASGFSTVRKHGLSTYLTALDSGCGEERGLQAALLHLLAYNLDTNVIARGGMDGLAFVQGYARGLLSMSDVSLESRLVQLCAFDQALIARNLSPGGSADLLAVTWFLACFPVGNA